MPEFLVLLDLLLIKIIKIYILLLYGQVVNLILIWMQVPLLFNIYLLNIFSFWVHNVLIVQVIH